MDETADTKGQHCRSAADVAAEVEALQSSGVTRAGHVELQDWIANERAQAELRKFRGRLESHREQLLGIYTDHLNQRLVVVVDPESGVDGQAAIESAVGGASTGFAVVVVLGCNSRSDLLATEAGLHDDAVAGLHRGASTFGIDPASGTVQVLVESDEDASRIQREYGDLVQVEVVPQIGHTTMPLGLGNSD